MNELLCLEKCPLNENEVTLKRLEDISKNTTIKTFDTNYKDNPYRLEYAPVGNDIKEPTVIICGKTPDRRTWERFLKTYRETGLFTSACYKSIFSNMKDNLFCYLNSIGFFSYMDKVNEYWIGENKKELWNRIFTDEICSKECGIQLTQSCNCAILHGSSSNEPPLTVFENINESCPGCFFNRFNISDKLKIIIFLDTPYDNVRFHQIHYWNKSSLKNKLKDVKVISITHPSSQNNDIYRHLDLLNEKNNNTRIRNAAKLKREATDAIMQLKQNI